MSNLKLAFIGGSGHHYLRMLLEEPDLRPAQVAVCPDGFEADAVARMPEGADVKRFDDPGAMFKAFKPDVVNIGARYGRNAEVVARALEHGAAVVSDKPIAATWDQLATLRRLHERTGLPLITEFPFRARPEFVAARQAVRDGRIGAVVLASAQKSYRFGQQRPPWYAQRDEYGGTILWVASHGIDAIAFTTGQRFTHAFGRHGNVSRPDYGTMEDHTVSVFGLSGGGTALVHADYLRPAKAATHGDDRLRIAGGTGVVEVRDGRCRLVTADDAERDITDEASPAPAHQQLIAAARGEASDAYNTEASFDSAAVLLHARDAADQERVIAIER